MIGWLITHAQSQHDSPVPIPARHTLAVKELEQRNGELARNVRPFFEFRHGELAALVQRERPFHMLQYILMEDQSLRNLYELLRFHQRFELGSTSRRAQTRCGKSLFQDGWFKS